MFLWNDHLPVGWPDTPDAVLGVSGIGIEFRILEMPTLTELYRLLTFDVGLPVTGMRWQLHDNKPFTGGSSIPFPDQSIIDSPFVTGMEFREFRRTQDRLRFQRRLPLRPVWPEFAINTIFYAAILWVLFAAPLAFRRRRRINRGCCGACGYPVGTSKVCTECGRPVEIIGINADSVPASAVPSAQSSAAGLSSIT
jgi:hypothetical protein